MHIGQETRPLKTESMKSPHTSSLVKRGKWCLLVRARLMTKWNKTCEPLSKSLLSGGDQGRNLVKPQLKFKKIFNLYMARGILIPQSGSEPMPPAVKAWSPIHWTIREVARFKKVDSLSSEESPFVGNSLLPLFLFHFLKNVHKICKLISLKPHRLMSISFPIWRNCSPLGLDYGLRWEESIPSTICISWPHSPCPRPSPSTTISHHQSHIHPPSRASHCGWPVSHVSSSHFVFYHPLLVRHSVSWNQGGLWF